MHRMPFYAEFKIGSVIIFEIEKTIDFVPGSKVGDLSQKLLLSFGYHNHNQYNILQISKVWLVLSVYIYGKFGSISLLL